jgi:hypothetical protein
MKQVWAERLRILRSQKFARFKRRWLYHFQQHPRVFLSEVTLLTRLPALLAILSHHVHGFASEGNDGYFQIAQNVVTRGIIGLDSHHLLTRGPLFPLILAPGFLLQHPVLWTLAVNLAASIGICLLVFEACLLWSQSSVAASAAAFLVVANPWLIWTVKNPTPTITATFLTALASYLLARVAFASAGKELKFCLYLGGVSALAALDHPALIALIAGFSAALFLILWHKRAISPLLGLIVLWSGFAACIAPYSYRNFRITGRFIPVADSAPFSYLMGTGLFGSSIYPVGDFRDFSKVAARLHVTVEDLDVQFYTIDDRYYPLLSSLAKQDFETLLSKHPLYLLFRTFIMSLWFWCAGDKFVWLTVAHCVYWLLFASGMIVAIRRQGVTTIAPFVALVIPGALLHGMSMPLIGYAAYSIPYCVLLAAPLAIGLKDSKLLDKLLPQSERRACIPAQPGR